MQYLKLDAVQRKGLWAGLAAMPDYLREFISRLSPAQIRTRGPDGFFAPVEQIWHLADLEREGFGLRIHRLLTDSRPRLPDFDGTQIAKERNYLELSIADGLSAFCRSRLHNLSTLQTLDSVSWLRAGVQDGIGEIALCDIPGFMAQHDAAHKLEIAAWKQSVTG
jgi:hypothetical protein